MNQSRSGGPFHGSDTEHVESPPEGSFPMRQPFTNGTADEDITTDQPRKRRKLSESYNSRQNVELSRAPSPPWKKAAADGPSTFVEDGRRKSSRTNALPLDLLSPADARKSRRGAVETPKAAKSKYGGASINTPKSSSSRSAVQYSRFGRHIRRSAIKPREDSPTSSPTKAKRVTSHQSNIASPEKRRPGRPKSQHTLAIEAQQHKKDHTATTHKSPRTKQLSKTSNEVNQISRPRRRVSDIDYVDLSKGGQVKRYPRLKFRIRMPELPSPSFHNVPRPRKYSSFQDWFENDPVVKEETSQISREDAEREGLLRQRLLQESELGGVLSQDRCSAFLPDKEDEPAKQYSHADHLASQAIHFRTLMQSERKRHVAEAKRLAQAVVAEVKRRRPKTQEELEQEYHDRIVAAHRQVCRDLLRKWSRVTEYINQRRLAKWEEEQDLLQKQALDNVLQQSSKLLDARVSRNLADEDIGNASASDSDDGMSGMESGTGSEPESIDESNMSSSGSDDNDQVDDDEADLDAGLSVDDLRRKYALSENVSDEDELMTENKYTGRVLSETGSAAGQIQLEEEVESPVYLESSSLSKRRLTLESNGMHSTMEFERLNEEVLDASDESTDMDTGIEDSDEDEESEEDDDSDEYESDGPGLQGFYDIPDAGLEAKSSTSMEGMLHSEKPASSAFIQPSEDVVNHEVSEQYKGLTNGHHDVTEISDPFSRTSPGTNATTKPSDPDSRSSVDLHDSEHASSATTPQPVVSLKTPIPFLLRGSLREYQHYGLDWLANLYVNKTNGILADEMGLGKTIQTIALLAHLACVHQIWGPHLVIVPTSVMLNWEMEFKKWCPGFKILTYYGTQERRKELRKGWLNDDMWNVCITSYQLVIQDQQAFKRRNWHFMILDEAHHIKNFQSLKWQTLLTFKTVARLLLTGTPLQNGLEELWALLFFLMPTVQLSRIGEFASREEFQEWFREIKVQIVDKGASQLDPRAQAAVADLHKVLRPFLLRRLKADVEKQMPPKFEHVVDCRLSKRQRHLYDEFMSRGSTKDALIRGNSFSIMNCVMSLRKVCNHPDLFETRQIVTSYAMRRSAIADYEIKELLVRRRLLDKDSLSEVDLEYTGLLPVLYESHSKYELDRSHFLGALESVGYLCRLAKNRLDDTYSKLQNDGISASSSSVDKAEDLSHLQYLESIFSRQWMHAQRQVIYGKDLTNFLTLQSPLGPTGSNRSIPALKRWERPSALRQSLVSVAGRASQMELAIQKFAFVTPPVVVEGMNDYLLGSVTKSAIQSSEQPYVKDPFHEARIRLSIAFPDKRLLQYDCGKLQQLDKLLRQLQAGGHRVLIFTQMTKVLDILEQFMNIHGHRYLRLDGQTKIEQRQILTERFNSDPRILAFILSSRSGGLGINLTGADTVIFYDLDWNPSADKQCQDRCHRIGQTREVHIYRLVSESTIESNILRKANQKRMLDNVVIQEGDFTTDYFNKLSVRDMLGDDIAGLGDAEALGTAVDRKLGGSGDFEKILENVEDAEDVKAAKIAKSEADHVDEADFAEKDGNSITPAEKNQDADRSTLDPSSSIRTNPETGNVIGNPEASVELPEPNHLDDYLIRFMEFALTDVPLFIPPDKLRARHKKNQHRIKKHK